MGKTHNERDIFSMSNEERVAQARAKARRRAEEQGKKVPTLDDLKGDFWPEEESLDEFLNTLREWRQ